MCSGGVALIFIKPVINKSDQLHASAALSPKKEHPVLTEQ